MIVIPRRSLLAVLDFEMLCHAHHRHFIARPHVLNVSQGKAGHLGSFLWSLNGTILFAKQKRR